MTVNRKPTGTASSVPAALAYGGLMSLATTMVLTAITAKLVDSGIIIWGNVGYAVLGILLISSWLGATITAGKIKRQRLLSCMAAGGVYFGVLLLMTALFFGGKYSGVIETGLLILCGSVLAAFSGKGGGKIRKNRNRRH